MSYHDTLFINLHNKQSFFAFIALMKTLEYRNRFLSTIFWLCKRKSSLYCSASLFWKMEKYNFRH